MGLAPKYILVPHASTDTQHIPTSPTTPSAPSHPTSPLLTLRLTTFLRTFLVIFNLISLITLSIADQLEDVVAFPLLFLSLSLLGHIVGGVTNFFTRVVRVEWRERGQGRETGEGGRKVHVPRWCVPAGDFAIGAWLFTGSMVYGTITYPVRDTTVAGTVFGCFTAAMHVVAGIATIKAGDVRITIGLQKVLSGEVVLPSYSESNGRVEDAPSAGTGELV